MSKKKKLIDDYTHLIGNKYNWLTITDIIQTDHGIMCQCKCKCGNECVKSIRNVCTGHTTSCGCYKYSKEFGNKISQWSKDNPDQKKEQGERYSRWCKDHPEILKEKGKKHSQYFKDHPDIVQRIKDNNCNYWKSHEDIIKERNKKHSQWFKDNPDKVKELANKVRDTINSQIDHSFLLEYKDYIHPDDLESLLKGSQPTVRTKCPICNNYDTHCFSDAFSVSRRELKRDLMLCSDCYREYTTSKYEDEVAKCVSEFYHGEVIQNSREIISPKELDLYYPDKKIAIEFNGDYFHSVKRKDKDYHVSKFKLCRENGILLVSIFESAWRNNKGEIKEYLKDLFSDKENSLSFNEDKTLMNNNYPSPYAEVFDSVVEDFYVYDKRSDKVFTCGFSKVIKE